MTTIIETVKDYFAFTGAFFKAKTRKRRLMAAERLALVNTQNDRAKRWIIHGQGNRYITLTSNDMNYNKRIRVFKKDLTAYELDSKADSVVLWSSRLQKAVVAGKNGGL